MHQQGDDLRVGHAELLAELLTQRLEGLQDIQLEIGGLFLGQRLFQHVAQLGGQLAKDRLLDQDIYQGGYLRIDKRLLQRRGQNG